MKNLLLAMLCAACVLTTAATAQEVTNTNHTIVRFEILTAGNLYGTMDVELFDQEKPETVKNFLRYIYRGRYSNLVLHRLVTNFVLQAGHVRIENPTSTAPFTDTEPLSNFGMITNEYSVGPTLSNVFGTIAMARIGGQTNSASTDFFFNLADNLPLDAVDGGFTVFGRVVNTTGPLTGTNLLNHFNTVNRTAVFLPDTFEFLSDLPVSTSVFEARYSDLFTVRMSIVGGPHVINPDHSVVRFNVFTGGTNYGTIDIELFDQEKPETVKNFLLYVHSGVYSNLVLHRLDPNFILQAGRVRLQSPDMNAAFSSYTPSVNWGDITNEYGVGPEIENAFGTVAMSRVPGKTNSASYEFFFNLTNNASLNTNEGGYTVFGKVVNSFDSESGTNLLGRFNTFRPGDGIGSAFIFDYFDFLTEIPVSANRPTTMQSDLFLVKSEVIQGNLTRDITPPVVSVNESTNAAWTSNGVYRVSGVASDNMEVAKVLIDRQDGLRTIAGADGEWFSDVELVPGTNRITVRSLDYFGNLSAAESRTIFYSVPRAVTLEVQGKGTVTGVTNGQILEVGVTYPFTAKPARGYYWNGWRGTTETNGLTVAFTMAEEGKAVARFTKTLLGLAPGVYEGVFAPNTNSVSNAVGTISLTLRANGGYTGRLKPLGANYFIRGGLNAGGNDLIYGPLGTNVLVLAVSLTSQEGDGRIVGSYTDGRFGSFFTLYRRESYTRSQPSPYEGRYTFQISPIQPAHTNLPEGLGFGTVTVSSSGRVRWNGLMANGSSVSQSAYVLKDGRWPMVYSKRSGDLFAGLMTFSTNGTFGGGLRWYGRGFPNGTNQNVTVRGSEYIAPPTAPLMNWTNGVLTLSGDGLTESITNSVTLNPNGTLSVVSTNNVQLTVRLSDGTIRGSFTHPVTGLTTPINAGVLQSSNTAAGFFKGTGRNGRAFIQAQ